MKRRILLFGNTSGLPGVSVDIDHYVSFFTSDYGGAWNQDEIIVRINPELTSLRSELLALSRSNLDYLIVVYSGHGGWERNTILEINEDEETISEIEINNIARKQLTILDCCRSSVELEKSALLEFSTRSMPRDVIRRKYEDKIKEAIAQNIRLYACKIGETATDTPEGGVYSVNLIKSALNLNGFRSKTVGICHQEAHRRIKNLGYAQNPEAFLPRCLESQQLILSINP